MRDELMNKIDDILLSLSKVGSKPAKILLLKSKYNDIQNEIIKKYCLEEKVNEAKQDMVINFLEQTIQLVKDLKSEVEKM